MGSIDHSERVYNNSMMTNNLRLSKTLSFKMLLNPFRMIESIYQIKICLKDLKGIPFKIP